MSEEKEKKPMTEEEFRALCDEYGYTKDDADYFVQMFVTRFLDAGLKPTPYEDIPLVYQRY